MVNTSNTKIFLFCKFGLSNYIQLLIIVINNKIYIQFDCYNKLYLNHNSYKVYNNSSQIFLHNFILVVFFYN